ncbi:MAG: hypothetical protein Q4E61_03400, partial [Alphaproteobacteria bacterium]|nr:hypothetical protein [Alphaproteobacteria bacterium]
MVDLNEIMKRRTKKNVISEIIAIVVFVLLNIAFKAYCIEYNVNLLKEQDIYGPYVHKFCETINPKVALKNFIYYDPKLELYMNDICENEVGKTLIRRMYDTHLSNIENQNRLKTLNIKLKSYVGPNGNILDNLYHPLEFSIYINLEKLGSCIGYRNGNIEEIPNTADSVIFHEMGHAFHDLTKKEKLSTATLDYLYSDKECIKLWTNFELIEPIDDEELYNITGYFYENNNFKFDPINCNMYEICKACKFCDSREKIFQRIFHTNYFDIEKYYKKELFLGH